MEFVGRELNDPTATRCGNCANCSGDIVSRDFDAGLAAATERFLGHSWILIPPRKMLPHGPLPERKSRKLSAASLVEAGLALCSYSDSELGDLVRRGKYENGQFDDKLIHVSREAIISTWPIDTQTWWVTAVPSLRDPRLVADFAQRLADELELPFFAALSKSAETEAQKSMQNSAQQLENVLHAFQAEPQLVRPGPVILIDDMIDSRWTMTVCGARLRRAGSGPVHPFALATFRQGG
ncbi:MAG: phosphoribosyltransferase [Thermomicrobiales bacterium]